MRCLLFDEKVKQGHETVSDYDNFYQSVYRISLISSVVGGTYCIWKNLIGDGYFMGGFSYSREVHCNITFLCIRRHLGQEGI